MSVTAPTGFVAAGVTAGIKASGDLDLALVATDDGRAVAAAAVFTRNLVCAAPVQVSREHLVATGGRVAAVVLNSGNANAATGLPGRAVAEETCALVAGAVGCAAQEVLVCSTGLIGIPMDPVPLRIAVPVAVAALGVEGGADAARALMTTDTRPKEAVARSGVAGDGRGRGTDPVGGSERAGGVDPAGRAVLTDEAERAEHVARAGPSDLAADVDPAERAVLTDEAEPSERAGAVSAGAMRCVTVGGMAKGAAMLSPDMATMLAVLTTDAAAGPALLRRCLQAAVDDSFNRLTVDGCTSTNDTVILLANGRAGTLDEEELTDLVRQVTFSLASQMCEDAEGATKSVRVTVTGAAGDEAAAAAARKVAGSQLVKCSWYGQDPYWGRVLSDLGTAGVELDLDRITIAYGGVVVSRGTIEVDHDRPAVAAHMAGRGIDLTCDLGVGDGSWWLLTNDLTHAYVDENMGTS